MWIFNQLPEFNKSEKTIIYLEQGSEMLFGDYRDLSSDSPYRLEIKKSYLSNFNLSSISSTMNRILKARFNKESYIIPNFVDMNFYYPIDHKFSSSILLVGNHGLKFKGFNAAIETLQKLWNTGCKFNISWSYQIKLEVRGINFPINFIGDPY